MRRATLVLVAALAGCSAADPTVSSHPLPSVTDSPAPSPSIPAAAGSSSPSQTPAETQSPTPAAATSWELTAFPVIAGSRPHDVAPAADGGVWYTGQGNGTLGWLDPDSGEVREIRLGAGSAPHGVIVGPDGDAWITDGGLNAILRVDAATEEITSYPLAGPNVNLNTATFDGEGVLWFTGQGGVIGSVDPDSGEVRTLAAPRGAGPYGIATDPAGEVWFSSLAGSYLGAIERATGAVTVIDTPTPAGGARRVWPDSEGRLWITQWFTGSIARHDPESATWQVWDLPGAAQPYAIYVDELDAVWVTDFGGNALHRFDPGAESWTTMAHDSQPANVRQLLGRPGEVWGAESAADRLVVARPVP